MIFLGGSSPSELCKICIKFKKFPPPPKKKSIFLLMVWPLRGGGGGKEPVFKEKSTVFGTYFMMTLSKYQCSNVHAKFCRWSE